MSVLVYSSRALTGREGKLVMQHFNSVETFDKEIDFLTMNLNLPKLKVEIDSCTLMDVNCHNHYSRFYDEISKTAKLWSEVYDALDVTPLKHYRALFVIGGIHYPNSLLERGTKRAPIFPKDGGQIKYQSVGKVVVNVLAILKAHNEYGIPLHHICFDPAELSLDLIHEDYRPKFDHHLYHGYDIPKYNIKRLDSCQYGFSSKRMKKEISLFDDVQPEKSLDFVFGYTANSKERAVFIPYLKNLASKFENARLLLKTDQIDDLVDRDAYLTLISKSKYTFMLQSYDKHCFSIYRFVESLENDCLPLIHTDVNIDDVSATFGIDLSILKRDEPFSDDERLKVLKMLKEAFLHSEYFFQINALRHTPVVYN
jgi:hypothetical protein